LQALIGMAVDLLWDREAGDRWAVNTRDAGEFAVCVMLARQA
jgi:hypothetical protein